MLRNIHLDGPPEGGAHYERCEKYLTADHDQEFESSGGERGCGQPGE